MWNWGGTNSHFGPSLVAGPATFGLKLAQGNTVTLETASGSLVLQSLSRVERLKGIKPACQHENCSNTWVSAWLSVHIAVMNYSVCPLLARNNGT